MITLRPYQEEALAAVMEAMGRQKYVLIQAGTGAGKTILFSSIIQKCMREYNMRIAVVAHREILVRQAYEKLLRVAPEAENYVGLACSSVSKDIDLDRPVIIGSPQTLANRLGVCRPVNLVIIDECHRVPPRNEHSQYGDMLAKLEAYYPPLRIIGVTATPYRLGHGYIYGCQCRKGSVNWWPSLTCSISIGTLQDAGWLVPLHAKEAVDMDDALSCVRTSKGEFDTHELAALMGKPVHITNAVTAYEKYAQDRRHVVVFAVTIEHAERLCEAFAAAGYRSGVVHSRMPKAERDNVLRGFDDGSIRVVCNVGVLTEGWDSTGVDCMLMCRPTMSPALFVQMVGRGLRLHEGKADCLLLDLSGNCARHGSPDNPVVTWSDGTKKAKSKERQMKTCPDCEELVSPDARECPGCGYEFPHAELVEARKDNVEMRDVLFAGSPPFMQDDSVNVEVKGCRVEPYTSKAGNRMLRLSIECRMEHVLTPTFVNHFMDIEGHGSLRGKYRAQILWARLAGSSVPSTVDEANARQGELRFPDALRIKKNGRYYNVVGW